MKKAMLVVLFVLAIAGFVMAQTYSENSGGNAISGIDKLGAHQNGGRGCTGCHAPHSGARGNGGNAVSWVEGATTHPVGYVGAEGSGDETLWGQDLTPVYALGSLSTGNGGNFTVNVGTPTAGVLSGVMLCLSCHDGNVAKGAMMQNKAYEQQYKLGLFAAGSPADGYGPADIPTLLGADGSGNGNYENDHPIGPLANLGAVGKLSTYWELSSSNKLQLKNATNEPTQAYASFKAAYGAFQVPKMVIEGTPTAANAYVVCTTCHTPHTMYLFRGAAGTYLATTSVFPSYFFIAAPYNPGANILGGTRASSATQFCRQCHFSGAGGANETYGFSVQTAF